MGGAIGGRVGAGLVVERKRKEGEDNIVQKFTWKVVF